MTLAEPCQFSAGNFGGKTFCNLQNLNHATN